MAAWSWSSGRIASHRIAYLPHSHEHRSLVGAHRRTLPAASGHRAWHRCLVRLRRIRPPRCPHSQLAARPRCAARRPRDAVPVQHARIFAPPVGHLVGRCGGGARQRQAARARSRVDRPAQRGAHRFLRQRTGTQPDTSAARAGQCNRRAGRHCIHAAPAGPATPNANPRRR